MEGCSTPSLTGLSDKAKTLGAEVKNNVMYWGIAEQVPKPNEITLNLILIKRYIA